MLFLIEYLCYYIVSITFLKFYRSDFVKNKPYKILLKDGSHIIDKLGWVLYWSNYDMSFLIIFSYRQNGTSNLIISVLFPSISVCIKPRSLMRFGPAIYAFANKLVYRQYRLNFLFLHYYWILFQRLVPIVYSVLNLWSIHTSVTKLEYNCYRMVSTILHDNCSTYLQLVREIYLAKHHSHNVCSSLNQSSFLLLPLNHLLLSFDSVSLAAPVTYHQIDRIAAALFTFCSTSFSSNSHLPSARLVSVPDIPVKK